MSDSNAVKFSMLSLVELNAMKDCDCFKATVDNLNQLRIARDEVSEHLADLEKALKEQVEIFNFLSAKIDYIRAEANSRKLPYVLQGGNDGSK